jgi:hypothetical protein
VSIKLIKKKQIAEKYLKDNVNLPTISCTKDGKWRISVTLELQKIYMYPNNGAVENPVNYSLNLEGPVFTL